MKPGDWEHVLTLLNVIEACARHGTSFTALRDAATAELQAMQAPPDEPAAQEEE